MRYLAVDHGLKHIGIAISDPMGIFATPFLVLDHVQLLPDAENVAQICQQYGVGTVIVGQSVDDEGNPTLEGLRSARFADTLKNKVSVPILLWDESLTTNDALAVGIEMGKSRRKRKGHHDALAATILLQSYLDAKI